MTIQDIGSIGELLAAIATIATLFYLARQVRANTRQAQTASRVEITRDYRAVNSAGFDPEISRAFAIGLRQFPDMPYEEAILFRVWFVNHMMIFQGVFAQYENGQLEDETYEAWLAFFSGMVATPGGSRYWEVAGRGLAPRKMVAAVDECIAKGAFPELLEKSRMAFLQAGTVHLLQRGGLKDAVASGALEPDTLYFDNTLATKKELDTRWPQPAGQTWLTRYFGQEGKNRQPA